MSAWARVANLGKAKNLKGGLLAYPCEGLPFLLEEGMEVVFVPPVLRVPRVARITRVQEQAEGAHLVSFDSISTIDQAEQLVGHSVLVRKADLPEGYDRSLLDLAGFEVFSRGQGHIGTIVSLEENPAHPLLVVESSTSSTIHIPLVEEFLVDLNEKERRIELDLPAGLVEL